MAQFINRIVGRPKNDNFLPFEIAQSGNKLFVSSGRCYSTFTYSYDALIPIGNLYSPIPSGQIAPGTMQDYCVYIDFTILPNLQVSGAEVKMTKVGRKTTNEKDWKTYPDQYRIRPYDERNPDGTIKQIINGKKQEKAYLMLGKISENYPDIDPYKITTITGMGSNGQPKNYYLSQYVNSDLILMGSQISGVPIVFTMGYVGGPYYKTPEEYPIN